MYVKILKEAGHDEAMLGLSLSYNQPVENMPLVADRLVGKGGSHAKFMESIAVWLDVRAPRYWWQQFDTYRIGVTKQSESTMHTVMKRELVQGDFDGISTRALNETNFHIRAKDFTVVKSILPEGFLQRRVVCTNYKALAHIYWQRVRHKLPEWRQFCAELMGKLQYPQYVVGYGREGWPNYVQDE
jgi:hypothetical protein